MVLMVTVAEVSLSFPSGCVSSPSAAAKPGVLTPRTPCGLRSTAPLPLAPHCHHLANGLPFLSWVSEAQGSAPVPVGTGAASEAPPLQPPQGPTQLCSKRWPRVTTRLATHSPSVRAGRQLCPAPAGPWECRRRGGRVAAWGQPPWGSGDPQRCTQLRLPPPPSYILFWKGT